jgi:hypothetical protein
MCALPLLISTAVAHAQSDTKMARVSYLSDVPASLHAPGTARAQLLSEFREGLREAGYIEKQNLTIEYRFAEGVDRLPDLAARLVAQKFEVIVAAGTASLKAARGATTTLPIVTLDLQIDPVADGLPPLSRGRAVTSRDCFSINPSSQGNGWSFSKTPFPTCPGPPSYGMPRHLVTSCVQSRPPPRLSG